jgi:ribosomal protein S18 acetylase RimI-like enzyme
MIAYAPAKPSHGGAASLLLHATMGPFADAALGLGDHSFCLRALREVFTRPGNRFSFDRAIIGLDGEEVAALLIAFPGGELGGRNRVYLRQSLSIYGIRKYLRLLGNFILGFTSKECENDEYYIAHLAVAPAFRNQGIARVLLAKAENNASKAGLHKISLLVEIGHNPAITLYQAVGYKMISTFRPPGLEKRFHSPGYHRMLKII